MNIVYLIGNGFDINLGMKTRYTDFYQTYLKKESKSNFVEKLKSDIFSNVQNWSDLELALGQYTSAFSNLSEFDEVFDDLINSLCDYLEEEYEKYDFDSLDVGQFFKDLCGFDRFLSVADRSELDDYKRNWKSNHKSNKL